MPVSRRGARSRIDPISPVILLGGIGCSVIEWENNIGALARQRKVYALDMLGDGLTDKPQGDRYALKDRAKFTCDFLQERASTTAGADFFWARGDLANFLAVRPQGRAVGPRSSGTMAIHLAGGGVGDQDARIAPRAVVPLEGGPQLTLAGVGRRSRDRRAMRSQQCRPGGVQDFYRIG